jgi:hypothetical protein
MEFKLIVEDWENTNEVSLEEVERRFVRNFPSAIIDRQRGDADVQECLDRLIATRTPKVILESHRSQFGDTAFVTVGESRWAGATATSYLSTIRPPLGDRIEFDVQGAEDGLASTIARELAAALEMFVLPENPEDEE